MEQTVAIDVVVIMFVVAVVVGRRCRSKGALVFRVGRGVKG